MRKPRGFQHNYIYYDPRRERLAKIEERAKREMGELPPKEFEPEDIRGKFVGATHHLAQRKARRHRPLSNGVLVLIIIGLCLLMRYLMTGRIF